MGGLSKAPLNALRFMVGGIFMVAGLLKLWDPGAFMVAIEHYHLVPRFIAGGMAVYLPCLEFLAGLQVVAFPRQRGALPVLLGLCVVFTAALLSAWVRGLDVDCGCFGAGLNSTVPWALARVVALGGATFVLFRAQNQRSG